MTSSNGNIFRVTGYLCGEYTGQRWIPPQRTVTRGFDVFFDLRLNKRLSKQSWGWWFETPSRSLWRHCNAMAINWSHGIRCNWNFVEHIVLLKPFILMLLFSAAYRHDHGSAKDELTVKHIKTQFAILTTQGEIFVKIGHRRFAWHWRPILSEML